MELVLVIAEFDWSLPKGALRCKRNIVCVRLAVSCDVVSFSALDAAKRGREGRLELIELLSNHLFIL